ncbi:MAG: serine hydroxymethyltransferase [Sulfolobales archaeon]|nr:serine hydroxymethyltransferase [Sulfolobales archaeon]MDW8082315.1 serine hydroxymethyltransferase [Sulfolobales archaeon]
MSLPPESVKIVELTRNHNRWRRFECVNLIASENTMSPLAEAAYFTDMMHRYAEGKPGRRYYQGNIFTDEVELLLMDLMSKLLKVKYVEPRPISGTVANAVVFRVLANPGDRALIAPVQAGAHVSHTKFGTLGALGIEQIELPFDLDLWNIDVDRAVKMIEEIKPKFVTLGASVYLFPHPTKEISSAAHSVGARVVHDVAHVLGLIAGGKWPNPIHEGADIATSSTHKTFPGPQGGVIFTDDEEMYKQVSKYVFPWFVSNHHLHRLPATAITAVEMMYFGEAYASQIVRNSKAFAEALAGEGFKVLAEHLGYTKSHTIVVDVRPQGGGARAAKLLEDANIIVNKNLLPWDPPEAVRDPSGIRLGTQEMTRFGMKEEDFRYLAKLIREVVVEGKDPREVRKKVVEFRKDFLEVKYGFTVPKELEDSPIKIPMLL